MDDKPYFTGASHVVPEQEHWQAEKVIEAAQKLNDTLWKSGVQIKLGDEVSAFLRELTVRLAQYEAIKDIATNAKGEK